MTALGLNWIERWALKLLHRSPRISLVILKPTEGFVFSWSLDPTDPIASAIADQLMEMPGSNEPQGMMLERLYHAPAYGEPE